MKGETYSARSVDADGNAFGVFKMRESYFGGYWVMVSRRFTTLAEAKSELAAIRKANRKETK